jgi:hypothetical protein
LTPATNASAGDAKRSGAVVGFFAGRPAKDRCRKGVRWLREPLHRDPDRLLGKQSQSGRPLKSPLPTIARTACRAQLISVALDALPGTS